MANFFMHLTSAENFARAVCALLTELATFSTNAEVDFGVPVLLRFSLPFFLLLVGVRKLFEAAIFLFFFELPSFK